MEKMWSQLIRCKESPDSPVAFWGEEWRFKVFYHSTHGGIANNKPNNKRNLGIVYTQFIHNVCNQIVFHHFPNISKTQVIRDLLSCG